MTRYLDMEEDLRRANEAAYRGGFAAARGVLQAAIEEVEREGIPAPATADELGLDVIRAILRRFHLVAVHLRHRHQNRATLDVADEYDVQDLLGSLLRTTCSDVRPEEWTPSYAGKSARMDFLLPLEETVIEVKKTRQGLGEKELGDELIIDIARYKAHPNCRRLICFVYDPEDRIKNPAGLMRDLSREDDAFAVEVLIVPPRG
jgi:hypothetical protein